MKRWKTIVRGSRRALARVPRPTRGSFEARISQHNTGHFGRDTASRRPVVLVFQQDFGRIQDAISTERQVKGWRRAKKEPLIRGEFDAQHELAMRYTPFEKTRRPKAAACSPRS